MALHWIMADEPYLGTRSLELTIIEISWSFFVLSFGISPLLEFIGILLSIGFFSYFLPIGFHGYAISSMEPRTIDTKLKLTNPLPFFFITSTSPI